MKNITSFTPLFEKDMYNSPLYGKEWNWRNIKMEARESHLICGRKGRGKGFSAFVQ